MTSAIAWPPAWPGYPAHMILWIFGSCFAKFTSTGPPDKMTSTTGLPSAACATAWMRPSWCPGNRRLVLSSFSRSSVWLSPASITTASALVAAKMASTTRSSLAHAASLHPGAKSIAPLSPTPNCDSPCSGVMYLHGFPKKPEERNSVLFSHICLSVVSPSFLRSLRLC